MKVWRAGAAVTLILCAMSCAGESQKLQIGSKAMTETAVLGHIVAELAYGQGVDSDQHPSMSGTRVLWNAILRGDIDTYVDYTGTLKEEIFSKERPQSREELAALLDNKGLVMSDSLGFANTYAFGMRTQEAKRLGIESISDLNAHPDLRFGFSSEFMERADGWPGVRATYDMPHKHVTGMDHELVYKGLAKGAIDVAELYTTDGEIAHYDLKVLRDDKEHFPDYEAVLLFRKDAIDRHPKLRSVMRMMEASIDEATMSKYNAMSKIGGQTEQVVAQAMLKEVYGVDAALGQTTLFDRIRDRSLEHLFLVGVSLFFAILLAIPLGIVAARRPKLGQVVLGVTGILQTIPSLALLVFMIPLFGVGSIPAMFALFVYSLLPIVRNTYAGLRGISPELIESANAIGLYPWPRLWLVEMPLASRSILAGIKTSAVINVGTATLGAFIGAGGYGQPILTGIRRDDLATIMEGAVPAAVLAIVVQLLFEVSERYVVPAGLRT